MVVVVVAVGLALSACGSGSADPASTTVVAPATVAVSSDVASDVSADVSSDVSAATLPPSTAAVSGLPAAATPTSPPATVSLAPCRVVAVGDSVGSGLIAQGLDESLAAVGCELLWTGGRPGITVTAGATELSGARAIDAEVALVILGYHNTRSETQSGRFPALIDTVMSAAGQRQVVWPLLGATLDCTDSYKTATGVANDNLRDATTRWPNLVLVDYTAELAAHPEYSEQRCPHLLPEGSRAVATWLAGQVRAAVDAAAG